MDDTKRLGLVGILALFIIGLAFSVNERVARADTGHEGATRKEIGSFGAMASLTGSSNTPTALFASSFKRPDGFAYNNTASTIWIGTVAVSEPGLVHSNILQGIPWPSSTTFKLDGSFTGSWYFNCDQGVSSCNVRRAEGKVQ